MEDEIISVLEDLANSIHSGGRGEVDFKFSKIDKGMLEGSISRGFFGGACSARASVSPSSVLACSQAIKTLYGTTEK